MLLIEPLEHVLEELLQCIVRVLGPRDHVIEQVLPELLLALGRVALVEHTDQLVFPALLVDLELQHRGRQEVVEDH